MHSIQNSKFKIQNSLKCLAVCMVICHLVSVTDVYAYLDPGTGSYVFQVLVAAVIGGLFAIKMFWQRIKAFFANHFSKKP
ncbi:MAG: hypothetical protein C0399_12030 [Syntrophus sp. (in: bacteria)]|nr:hypothetical protein [Syntrophus sp. (in: bacteria)]